MFDYTIVCKCVKPKVPPEFDLKNLKSIWAVQFLFMSPCGSGAYLIFLAIIYDLEESESVI